MGKALEVTNKIKESSLNLPNLTGHTFTKKGGNMILDELNTLENYIKTYKEDLKRRIK